MGKHYTSSYVKSSPEYSSFSVRKIPGTIVRAAFADEYLKKYGEDSLALRGFPKECIILEVAHNPHNEIVYFSGKNKIDEILADFHVKNPSQLRKKNIEVLLQFDKAIGIGKKEVLSVAVK